MNNKIIAKELLKIAMVLVSAGSNYIYDPEHKKHPKGGYRKTESGWSKVKKQQGQPSENQDKFSFSSKEKLFNSIANNPKSSSKYLNDLIDNDQDIDYPEAHLSVIGHPNVSNRTLKKICDNAQSYIDKGLDDIPSSAYAKLQERGKSL